MSQGRLILFRMAGFFAALSALLIIFGVGELTKFTQVSLLIFLAWFGFAARSTDD